YAEARRLIEQSLAVNPNDAGARGRLAVLEAKLGRHDEAERQLNGALALNPASPQLMYYRAVVLALSGKRAQAMAALSDAIGRGYSVSSAREDDDLASLRELPEFQALLRPGDGRAGR